MAEYKLGDGIKKVLLAGIGAVAVTAEKSQEVLDDLVKKGEITVEQGKELNKELQRNIKATFEKSGAEDVAEKVAKMTKEEIEALKAKISEIEAQSKAADEEVGDVVKERPVAEEAPEEEPGDSDAE